MVRERTFSEYGPIVSCITTLWTNQSRSSCVVRAKGHPSVQLPKRLMSRCVRCFRWTIITRQPFCFGCCEYKTVYYSIYRHETHWSLWHNFVEQVQFIPRPFKSVRTMLVMTTAGYNTGNVSTAPRRRTWQFCKSVLTQPNEINARAQNRINSQ